MNKTPAYQIKSVAKYDKEHTKLVVIKLNKKTDADILDQLSKVESKQGYIKGLIRQDIKNQT